MAERFNVVVIGSGPGGYAAAIRCAQKGASVALVEKDQMGGTCLNRGCIPSKALLGSVHFMTLARHAKLMGVEIGSITPNWAAMQKRKDAIVAGFRGGVSGLLRSNKVKVFEGCGIVPAPGQVRVDGPGGGQTIAGDKIILATGSAPIQIGAFPYDGHTIISSTDALSLPAVPASMVIIGGGVIGCEMACVYAAMGCAVTIVEALPQVLPTEDDWVGALMAKELKKLGITCLTGGKVTGVDTSDKGAVVHVESHADIPAEKVLVAVGRRACCDSETVQSLGLDMNGPAVKVNRRMETSAPGVYAIGDLVGTTYLAHGAFAEAEVAAANATGGNEEMDDYSLVPRAVYTFPEVASVGKNEKACAAEGREVVVGSAPFRTNGRSVCHNENVGEIRVIRDKTTDSVVGVTMVGAVVTEMTAAARALLGSREPIERVCFAHPTVSEVLKEAWEDAFGISLHVPPRR